MSKAKFIFAVDICIDDKNSAIICYFNLERIEKQMISIKSPRSIGFRGHLSDFCDI